MEFNGVLVLAAVWFLVSLLAKLGKRPGSPPGERRRAPRTGPPANRLPIPHGPGALDATQEEGVRLELVLREFQRALEQRKTPGRAVEPPIEEPDERRSLEVDPEVRSLEEDVRRSERLMVDQDDEAEKIEAGRIQAAAARDNTRTQADHAAFDDRIRKEAADHTATRRYTAQQLRDAVVWREILGPPASLRDE